MGDIYGTATKAGAMAEGSRIEASGLPVVAIGGITRERIPEVVAAGAAGVAVVSAVLRAADMEAAVRELCGAFPTRPEQPD